MIERRGGTIPVRDDGDFGQGEPRADKAFCGGVDGRHWRRILSCSNRLGATARAAMVEVKDGGGWFAIVGIFLGGIAGPLGCTADC